MAGLTRTAIQNLLVILVLHGCGGGGGGVGVGAPATTDTPVPDISPSPDPTGSGSTEGGAVINPSPTPITYTLTVSWTANREMAVNQSGGGYKIYYGTVSGFSLTSASYVDVPYSSGSQTAVNAQVPSLAAGTYYVRVVAYSALKPAGSSSGAISDPSAEISITVP